MKTVFHDRRLISTLFILFLSFSTFSLAAADEMNPISLESQVKAAYIYNFTKFVRWDKGEENDPGRPVTIFILGHDPLGQLLEKFAKKQNTHPPIIIKKMNQLPMDISTCDLFFLASSSREKLADFLTILNGKNILTVSDISGFARQGGMIGFIIENNRVKIEINLQTVKKSQLQISAKLLEIAKIVSGEGKHD